MITFKTEGFEELIKHLNSVDSEKALNRGLNKSSLLLMKNVMIETPVDTNTLRKSWKIKPGNLEYEVYNKTEYGIYVNNGTRIYRGNPFMERGLYKSAQDIRVIMFSEIQKEFNW